MDKKQLVIDCDKCKLSGECIKVCPQKAIFFKNGKTVIDYEKCDLDGICILACPENAIKFIESD